jgi:hypothetical protein
MNPIFNNYYNYFLKPGYKVSKILHIVYILAYKIYPSIKPNVNHKKDGQGDVSTFWNHACMYCLEFS